MRDCVFFVCETDDQGVELVEVDQRGNQGYIYEIAKSTRGYIFLYTDPKLWPPITFINPCNCFIYTYMTGGRIIMTKLNYFYP